MRSYITTRYMRLCVIFLRSDAKLPFNAKKNLNTFSEKKKTRAGANDVDLKWSMEDQHFEGERSVKRKPN